MKRGTETETSPGGVSRAGFRGLRIETGRGVAGLVGLPTFVFSHAETQSHGERRRALCGSATPVRQDKPHRSCELKGAHHVKCLWDM
jgi:hypothetical protein